MKMRRYLLKFFILELIFNFLLGNTLYAEDSKVIKKYYPDGKIMSEMSVKNKKLSGISRDYYPRGKLQAEMNYDNGLVDGVSKVYFENGQLQTEGNIMLGKNWTTF